MKTKAELEKSIREILAANAMDFEQVAGFLKELSNSTLAPRELLDVLLIKSSDQKLLSFYLLSNAAIENKERSLFDLMFSDLFIIQYLNLLQALVVQGRNVSNKEEEKAINDRLTELLLSSNPTNNKPLGQTLLSPALLNSKFGLRLRELYFNLIEQLPLSNLLSILAQEDKEGNNVLLCLLEGEEEDHIKSERIEKILTVVLRKLKANPAEAEKCLDFLATTGSRKLMVELAKDRFKNKDKDKTFYGALSRYLTILLVVMECEDEGQSYEKLNALIANKLKAKECGNDVSESIPERTAKHDKMAKFLLNDGVHAFVPSVIFDTCEHGLIKLLLKLFSDLNITGQGKQLCQILLEKVATTNSNTGGLFLLEFIRRAPPHMGAKLLTSFNQAISFLAPSSIPIQDVNGFLSYLRVTVNNKNSAKLISPFLSLSEKFYLNFPDKELDPGLLFSSIKQASHLSGDFYYIKSGALAYRLACTVPPITYIPLDFVVKKELASLTEVEVEQRISQLTSDKEKEIFTSKVKASKLSPDEQKNLSYEARLSMLDEEEKISLSGRNFYNYFAAKEQKKVVMEYIKSLTGDQRIEANLMLSNEGSNLSRFFSYIKPFDISSLTNNILPSSVGSVNNADSSSNSSLRTTSNWSVVNSTVAGWSEISDLDVEEEQSQERSSSLQAIGHFSRSNSHADSLSGAKKDQESPAPRLSNSSDDE